MPQLIEDADVDVLEPRQLVRISALHRGFLYQHLYAAACVLNMANSGATAVVIERDEDVELVQATGRLYIQVKTRSAPLASGDVDGALARFADLRDAHARGDRPGAPRFLVVSNVAPNGPLAEALAAADWPADVQIAWPGQSSDLPVPDAWPDLEAGLAACQAAAAGVAFAGLPPEALVWKLAAVAQYAATGAGDRRVTVDQLPALYEQFVVQLQTFPQPPQPYRPQPDEPRLDDGDRLRLLTGFSGAGKTAWASHAARHSAAPLAYFDVGDLPAAAVANSLGRELAARFLTQPESARAIAALPEAFGLDLFRHLAALLAQQNIPVVVVLDNVQRMDVGALRQLLTAAPALRFVMIAQPWPGTDELALLLPIQRQELAGWSADTIAAEFDAAGARIDAATITRLVRLTSALPLLIQSAARLAVDHYSGDAAAFCAAVEASDQAVETAPEIILRRAFEDLGEAEQLVASALSLLDAPLTREEVKAWVGAPLGEPARVQPAVKSLIRAGLVQIVGGDGVRLHDAFRIPAAAALAQTPAVEQTLLESLRDLIGESLVGTARFGRFAVWMRLLARTGQIDTLVDLATFEMFHERGDPVELYAVLETYAATVEDPEERFWALDALAFWDQRYERWETFATRVAAIEPILASGVLGKVATLAAVMKVMAAQGEAGNMKAVRAAYDRAARLPDLTEVQTLVLNYNLAFSQLKAKRPGDAAKTVGGVIRGYYRRLGLSEARILGLNPPDILALITPYEDMDDDFRHIGDALDLECHALEALRRLQPLHRMFALKFYVLGNAHRSYMKTALQFVDDMREMGQHGQARQFMEGMVLPNLPAVANMVVPVRRMYALLLAETGDATAGLAEMATLGAYDMPDYERSLFEAQWAMMRLTAS